MRFVSHLSHYTLLGVRDLYGEPDQAVKRIDRFPGPIARFTPWSAKKERTEYKVQNVGTVRKGSSFIFTPVIWF